MKLRNELAFMLTAAGLGFLPQSGVAQEAEYPELNLRYALFISSTLPQSASLQWWADQVAERSNGRINVEMYWSESLGGAKELLELVSSGAVDLASPAPAYYPTELALTNSVQLPMVFPDNFSAQLLAQDLSEVPVVMEENKANNIQPLFWTSVPTYHLLCTRPIRTLGELQGARLRSYGQYVPRMWEALGAVPVTTTSPEVYEGLQRGLIDCSYLSNDFAVSASLNEVAKFYVDVNFGAIAGYVAYINADRWNGLPENVRSLFLEVGAEAAAKDREDIRRIGDESLDILLERGVTRVEFEDVEELRAQVPNFLDVWVNEMQEQGRGEAATYVADAIRARVAESLN
ncbi:C4-dicarboxylate TRAP transporter substrate-binding protein [Paracoccus sp. (in: a-proteobacteria)]|uniref:C4-dicarboxylate TRAP transporter substrate-binding protein n=1 Tax=Paracoccus sp. TaxID=267 RepID=UPI002AFE7475|nr:C4-dicarboxylate TRAP transporter substrate-binding protein [Paracoccus sp. (in: a-proteobacteria)]